MIEFNILGASATTSTTSLSKVGTKATDAQLATEELQKQFQPTKAENKSNEPEFIEDKGEFDKIANDYRIASKKVNSVDQNTRTWTKNENGRYNDCPEAIEFYHTEDQFNQYINDKCGNPQQKGQIKIIVSNGNNYKFTAYEKSDGSLFWCGSNRPM